MSYLIGQFRTAWTLCDYHLKDLTTEECQWRPAVRGLHIDRDDQGRWRADWPDHEGYDLGPPSIGWLTWHLGFWWSMALDHNFGAGELTREDIHWPGDAQACRNWIYGLKDRWAAELEVLDEATLASTARTRWPFTDRPLGDVIAWANVELTKNAAEIGYARFLYAASDHQG
ncbi:DinB family protein [Phenylobacterium sp.]|jgi:hypothetical protein|uniref:DinB family protein n=1 Tax=Phenylobacterium sp. TaxID=1871053 RepID=UPI000C970BCE|nr:DinB family protein [Phenylobacterium sp.]MAK81970.1 hypothetical protein [Phenylobacterium sp.]|tara:strand:+ start:47887 stop:48402 length:516 start_codon:yes stop_codon:yes gene_type:complete